MVFRTYVEKRQGLAPECEALLTDCRDFLGVQGLRAARIWNRYDVEGIEAPLFENACRSVFSEPPLDLVSDAADTQDACAVFAVEPLPGQFDQRADSAAQCIQLLSQGERPRIRTAKLYALYGTLTDADVEAVKRYVINPVESREASLAKPETLAEELAEPKRVASVEGFTAMDEAALSALLSSMGLAMDIADLKALQDYFRETERRDPTVTEPTGPTTAATRPSLPTLTRSASTMTPSRAPMRAISPRARRSTARRRPPSARRRLWILRPSAQRRSRSAVCSPSSTRARRSTPAPFMCPPW